MQVEVPCTYDTMVVDYEEMIICALNQAPTGTVKCNVCATTHTFYQCPSLTGMDEEAQKTYIRMRALEKRSAKKTQYQVDQFYADEDEDDQDEDYSVPNADMTN